MSASTRDQRCAIYAYKDIGTDGIVSTAYTRISSPADDLGWWARIEAVSAQESRIAEQQAHRVDVVIEFSDAIIGLTSDGAVKNLATGELFKITGVVLSRANRAYIIHAVRADDEVYNNIVEALPMLGLLNRWIPDTGRLVDIVSSQHAVYGAGGLTPTFDPTAKLTVFAGGQEAITPSINLLTTFTWLTMLRLDAIDVFTHIILGQYSSPRQDVLRFFGSNGFIILNPFYFISTGSETGINTAPTFLSYAVTADPHEVKIYLQGKLVAFGLMNDIEEAAVPIAPVVFGRSPVSAGLYLTGGIGQTDRYDRALTASEIVYQHNILKQSYPLLPAA